MQTIVFKRKFLETLAGENINGFYGELRELEYREQPLKPAISGVLHYTKFFSK